MTRNNGARFAVGAAIWLVPAVLLSSCGDSVMLESVERKATVADLPSCSAENHGEEIFVEDERMLYTCGETWWTPFTKPADTTSAQTPLRGCGADLVPDDTASTCGEDGTFRDSRDGRIYKCVKIGDQTWMAENLDFGERIPGGGDPGDGDQAHASAVYAQKYCFDNDSANCAKYGGLYQWATAMGLCAEYGAQNAREVIQTPRHRGICPAGWHVPTQEEWETLVEFVQSPTGNDAGKALKSRTGWDERSFCKSWNTWRSLSCEAEDVGINGDDAYGWNALPGGFIGDGCYTTEGYGVWAPSRIICFAQFMATSAEFWTATGSDSWANRAVSYSIGARADSAWSGVPHKSWNSARSLRCVQD